MTFEELKARFPHASASTLRLNSGSYDLTQPEPRRQSRRRTIKAIIEQDLSKAQTLDQNPVKAKEAASDGNVEVFMPILTVCEANRSGHEHWRIRHARSAKQRAQVKASIAGIAFPAGKPTLIRCVRVSPRSLDHADNAPSAFKHIRDQLAETFGFNDRDQAVHWIYDHSKPGKGEPKGVRIFISWRPIPRCTCCGQLIKRVFLNKLETDPSTVVKTPAFRLVNANGSNKVGGG